MLIYHDTYYAVFGRLVATPFAYYLLVNSNHNTTGVWEMLTIQPQQQGEN